MGQKVSPKHDTLTKLVAKWRKEAVVRDDGTNGRSARSTGAAHLRSCADELEAAALAVAPQPAPDVEGHGNARCHCGHLSSRHAVYHRDGHDECGECDCEAFRAPREGAVAPQPPHAPDEAYASRHRIALASSEAVSRAEGEDVYDNPRST